MDNTNNFGVFLLPEIELKRTGASIIDAHDVYVDNNKKYYYVSINGCNGFVKSLELDFFMLVPKSEADATLTRCNTNFDVLHKESKFFHICYESVDAIYTNSNKKEFYIFKIPFHKTFNKRHYYTFCYLRHLYYYQSTLVNYFTYYQEDPIKKLYNFRCSGHSIFLNSYSLIIEDWYKYYTNSYNNGHFITHGFGDMNSLSRQDLVNALYCLHKIIINDYKIVDHKTDNFFKHGSKILYISNSENLSRSRNTISAYGRSFYIHTGAQHLIRVLSRHPSHSPLRGMKFGERVLLRLGSTTKVESEYDIYLNSIEAISISSNKYRMKKAFEDHRISTPTWYTYEELIKKDITDTKLYPMVCKQIYGSRGTGNYLVHNAKEFDSFIKRRRDVSKFIFEKFCNYSYEYRVHVSKLGIFMIWQKLRKKDTPENMRWVYNNDTSVFLSPKNENFTRIPTIHILETLSLGALKAVGLDIGALDVKMDKKGNFKVLEINSAPSIGEQGMEIYKQEITKLICAV